MFLLVFVFISGSLWSQSLGEDFDLLSKSLKFIENPKLEFECVDENPYAQVVCTEKDVPENVPSSLIYKVSDTEQLPTELRQYIGPQKVDKSSPLFIKVSLINDNFASFKGANDLNYTHGVLLELWKTNSSGKSFGATLNSDLYTQRILLTQTPNGKVSFKSFTNWEEAKQKLDKGESYIKRPEKTQDIQFLEDSWISFFMNNKAQGEWLVWQAGIGFEKIEQKEIKKIGAANFQNLLHQNSNIVKYAYHPSDQDTQFNLFLTGEVGAQNTIVKSHACDAVLHGELYGGIDTDKIRRYVGARLKTELRLISKRGDGDKLLNLTFSPNYWRQGGKNHSTFSAGGDLSLGKVKVGYQYIIPLGGSKFSNYLNTPNLGLDQEAMGQLTITVPLGSKKSKK